MRRFVGHLWPRRSRCPHCAAAGYRRAGYCGTVAHRRCQHCAKTYKVIAIATEWDDPAAPASILESSDASMHMHTLSKHPPLRP